MGNALLRLIRFLRRPADWVCHDDGTDAPVRERIATLAAWFASGTDCRCCIGMRVPFAFVVGLVIGVWL